jgi:hypothetical protein
MQVFLKNFLRSGQFNAREMADFIVNQTWVSVTYFPPSLLPYTTPTALAFSHVQGWKLYSRRGK